MARRLVIAVAVWFGAVSFACGSDGQPSAEGSSPQSGHVTIDDRKVAFEVVDRNANGDFRDVEDRLKLDLDGDGKFNPLREQFACRSVIKVEGQRYTLAITNASEKQPNAPEGIEVALSPLVGTGFIVPEIGGLADGAEVTAFKVSLVSDSGVQVMVENLNTSVEVPVGTYRVEKLSFEIKDQQRWKATFEKYDRPAKETVAVAEGQTVHFDVLGTLTLDGNLSGNIASAGISVSPALNTSTGLYLVRCLVGKIKPQAENRLNASLVDVKPGGKRDVLAVEGTGFACGSFCPITFANSHAMTPTSVVVLQFDAGPFGGPMIRVVKPHGIGNSSSDSSSDNTETGDSLDFD